MKLISWNVNGLRAVINKGGVYVSKLNAYAQWIAGDKYFFVGVGHNSNLITTYFIKTINMLNIYHCYKTRRYHYVY